MRPIFKCKHDGIEAHYYSSVATNIWLVQCFACGARAVYNTDTHELKPYYKNKNRKNEFNIVLERFVTDDGKTIPMGVSHD